MTEQDKQALIEYYCNRDCGHTREECSIDNCYEIMLIEEFPITPTDTDTISRQAAIDEIDEWIKAFRESGHKQSAADARLIQDGIIQLPSAQPYTIHSDGRLWVTVDDIDKVNAVVVDESKSMFCKQFYMDAQPEIVRCKNCKHWIPYDWMFSEVWQSKNIADYPEDEIGCNFCDMAMKANDFCSRGERREVKT